MSADGRVVRRWRAPVRDGRCRRGLALTTAMVLLVGISGCIRRRDDSSEGVREYAIAVHLQGPVRERGPAGSCEIASRAEPEDPFALDTVFLLENVPGPGQNQTRMVPGVLDDRQMCRVTLLFIFVSPDASAYLLRTRYGTGWQMSKAEAFADPVIDVVQRPPTGV